MKIIIDTNLWISFLIGKKLSIMKTLFTNTEIQIYSCDELMTEFNFVASRPKIRKYITDEDIRETYLLMEKYCYFFPVQKKAISPVRDKNDLYLLSFADTVSADFIITGDKDLLSLQFHNQTKILTYKEFSEINLD